MRRCRGVCDDTAARSPACWSATWPTSRWATRSAGHPVAGFGRAAAALERVTYRDSRVAGAVHVGLLVGAVGLLGAVVQRASHAGAGSGRPRRPPTATWVALGGTSLARTGLQMADLLDRGDVEAARRLLPSLCGRDPAQLDAEGLTRAALESVAENTSDAQVAPLLWAAAGGVPGVLVYRAVNTLDAMIGHRSPRYARFGWAAARLDDAGQLRRRARVAAVLVVVCAPIVGGSPSGALRAWRRDAAPSSQPQRRRRRGGLRRCAGRAARRPHAVPPRVADPAHPGRRRRRRRWPTCAARWRCRGWCRRRRRCWSARCAVGAQPPPAVAVGELLLDGHRGRCGVPAARALRSSLWRRARISE